MGYPIDPRGSNRLPEGSFQSLSELHFTRLLDS